MPAADNAVVIVVGQDVAVICYSVLSATKLGKSSYDIDCTNGNPVNKILWLTMYSARSSQLLENSGT